MFSTIIDVLLRSQGHVNTMKTLYVMVVVVGVARSMSWADRLAVWHECPDGKQECADDSTCCSAG